MHLFLKDVHEFLLALLDGFDQHLVKYHSSKRLLGNLFQGVLLSNLLCLSCGHRYSASSTTPLLFMNTFIVKEHKVRTVFRYQFEYSYRR